MSIHLFLPAHLYQGRGGGGDRDGPGQRDGLGQPRAHYSDLDLGT